MENGTIDGQFRRSHRSAVTLAIVVLLILTIVPRFCWSGEKKSVTPTAAPSRATSPAADAGFASADQNLFVPIIQLAPPGPDRAARAVKIFDRLLEFQRKIAFHPEITPELRRVRDMIPPRQSTLIRAAALYSQESIPWIALKDGTHEVCVDGIPRATNYLYTLAKSCTPPELPQSFSGVFAIKPPPGSTDGDLSSVVGELGGEVRMDTFNGGKLVDLIAAALRETRGDLAPPWDKVPGQFNQHDRAAIDRFKRDMPRFWGQLERYVDFKNYLDEFDSPSGPYVLFNVNAVVKENALRPFPHLYNFYHKVVPAVTASSAIYDSHGHYWMRTGFDHGHIMVTFMVQHGMLTPFDDHFAPAGDSVALDTLAHGTYRTVAAVHIQSYSLTFGLDNLSFTSDYTRNDDSISLVNRMDAIPELVAPIGIHQVMDLIVGEFMRVLAQGNGGLTTSISTRKLADDQFEYKGVFRGEYHYSPTLEFLAGFGDTIATKHNEVVRKEERNLGEELFDAFVADYNSARPKLLAGDVAK